ncbi:MAG: cystathionine beta-lyase [Pseudomonadota bacterium]
MKRDTQLVRAGRIGPEGDHGDGLVNPAIRRASTVLAPTTAELYQPTGGRHHYGRGGVGPNPELRAAIGELYQADEVVLTASGLSSVTHAILSALPDQPAGMQALITDAAYGPVRRFCDEELPRYGVTPVYYPPRLGAGIAERLTQPTALVLLESPGSLTFELQDIPAIASAARAVGVACVIDDTWSAGVLMNPLDLGVDYAAQALTKYVGGHSDFLMGAVSARGEAAIRARKLAERYGLHVSPDDAFLALRGLRTLGLRMDRSGQTGLELARRLDAHPRVARVLHPGLASSADHALFQRDFTGAAGCFSLILKDADARAGEAFVDQLELFGIGFSWGGYESLALSCDRQIRRSCPQWDETGALIRLAIGLEDVEDLWAALEASLQRLP